MDNRKKEIDMQAVKNEVERLEHNELLLHMIEQYDTVNRGYIESDFSMSEVANYDYK